MKKIVVIMVAFAIAFALTACSSSENEKTKEEIKKEEEAKAKKEIFIEDHYKTHKAYGYRFKIPKELKAEKPLPGDSKDPYRESKQYNSYNEGGVITDSVDYAIMPLGDVDVDKKEALEATMDGLEDNEDNSNVSEKKYITIAGVDAIYVTLKMKVSGIKYNVEAASWLDDDNNMFTMTIFTTDKNLDKYKYVFDTIIKEE